MYVISRENYYGQYPIDARSVLVRSLVSIP